MPRPPLTHVTKCHIPLEPFQGWWLQHFPWQLCQCPSQDKAVAAAQGVFLVSWASSARNCSQKQTGHFWRITWSIHCWFLKEILPSGKQELLCWVSWHLWRWFCFHTINDQCALLIGKLHALTEGTVSLAEFSGAPLLQDISPGKECSFCRFGFFSPSILCCLLTQNQNWQGRRKCKPMFQNYHASKYF